MQFVSVRDLRGHSARVWRELKRSKEIVITSNGKPLALLSSVSDENLEESLSLMRRARAMAAVESTQFKSVKAGLDQLSLEAINAEIQAVRRKRRP